MKDKLCEIDSAMNMIKEEIISDLYESVSKQNKDIYSQGFSTNHNLSFSEKSKD